MQKYLTVLKKVISLHYNLKPKQMKTTFSTKKIGSGQFEVSVYQDHELIGSYIEKSIMIDDIREMIINGNETALMTFDNFYQVKQYILSRIKK